jgi:transcription elongation GreA/GreB family factor
MEGEQEEPQYQANDANALVGELFSGEVSIAEAIERLRTRLLDLSARNRLLNYRHPKGRSVQVCDDPGVDLVFGRLFLDGKSVPLKYVPEPDPHTYEGKRPEARAYAPRVGISTSFEFPPDGSGSKRQRLHGLQTLLYPAELERQARKTAGEAKTAIEETGTNMLFLVFGFLEFYDSEDSDRPMVAPLLSLPVSLIRGGIDKDTRTYEYAVSHNGEDLAENHTLREKLRRDLMLNLPDFGEEDEPEKYFARIENAVRNKRRWKVRRQITLAMLSFGKLAIWADLDTKKNPGLLEHPLLKSVFSGGTGDSGGSFHAEDYEIDKRPDAAQPIVYDADSSQHSAIIDVLAGKNLVVNGPPGTGKSQTITNVIAAALSQGKKVLFVSEKLAALEVVRHRLNQAGLGHFCLELHSHKTQKKKFIEDLAARIEEQFPAPAQYQPKLATLQRQKGELARYAELMGSRVGNGLGMTVNEIFWAAERRRQELGEISAAVNAIAFADASGWTHDDVESRSARLSALAELHDSIGRFDHGHPWWGFRTRPLAPSDDEAIGRIVLAALDAAGRADAAADEAVAYFGLPGQPDADGAARTRALLDEIPPLPGSADPSLLPRMFDPDSDPKGQRSARLLADVVAGVGKAHDLHAAASATLLEGERVPADEAARMEELSRAVLSPDFAAADMGEARTRVARFEGAIEALVKTAAESGAPYGPAAKPAVDAFLERAARVAPYGLAPFPVGAIASRAAAVRDAESRLSAALSRVAAIAAKRDLPFDSTPDAVAALADPAGIAGLSPGVPTDERTLAEARRLVAFPLADKPLADLARARTRLADETSACAESLAACRAAVERLGMAFEATERGVAEAGALAAVAAAAPADLLEYRKPTFGHARTSELVTRAREAVRAEKEGRAALEGIFWMDALPSVAELRPAVAALRGKEGFLAFFDGAWRRARKLHIGLSKEKRKIGARERAEEFSKLIAWTEARDVFVSDSECAECFGGLFRGLDTDADRLARLDGWYVGARAAMVECPGLTEKVDLTGLAADRISELATKAEATGAHAGRLAALEATVRGILGADVAGFREDKTRGWDPALERLGKAVAGFDAVLGFFSGRVVPELSPRDALRLMEARVELDSAGPDLSLLLRGEALLKEAAGEEAARLAETKGADWKTALAAIKACARLAAETAEQASAFAATATPLSVAESFAAAKRELDAAWPPVARPAAWNRFSDWTGLADAATGAAASARGLLDRMEPKAKPGKSLAAVFRAYAAEAEARVVLSRFGTDDAMRGMLGDLSAGADTDLDRLADTHAWGAAVCSRDLPVAVRRKLLSADARDALAKARELHSGIESGTAAARSGAEDLSAFGSFSWDEWQRQTRGQAGKDLPSEMRLRLESAAGNLGAVLPWSKYLSLREQTRQEGMQDFVAALEAGKVPSPLLSAAFELAAFQSVGRAIYSGYPELSRFNGSAHEKTRGDYCALDAEIISITGRDFAHRIDRAKRVPEGQRGTVVGDYTEMHLLRREINKQRRHIPIRQLVKRAGRALQELKPCFMMGPLSVAQYLEQGALRFDLVVMDEASQLRPEDSLGAIARGSQLVVVGDPKQLPPTSFFDRMLDAGDDEDEDEAPAAISGMESILDICQQLFTPVRSLRWHYRSHHESLIAFSNHHFYKNLIVFPSPYAKNPGLGVKYRYVRGGSYKDRQNVPEAQRVVDAVLEHMIKRPDESLGVVTLNQTQRELIEELLDKKLKVFSEGADYLGRWEAEGWPFFVKNLENVQGDERDVIFISTTFGKAPGTDKVRQNFGPISRPDGWRRLNVLFTRSKRRIELFTSMVPEDIVTDERTPLGTKALRDYLDYAKRGVLVTTDEGDREPDSDFEVSVANVVVSLGYEVKPQLGVAGFFMDMAVRNPDRPGEFLAAIECDGATYHSGFSVRDRDRIRQEILESLGWKGRIHRIWSTDWFYNPRRETERLAAFLAERRRLSQAEKPEEIDQDEHGETEEEPVGATGPDEELAGIVSAAAGEDLFVEVGDRVAYVFVDDPNERHSVLIVDSASNAKMGIVNEMTPLAQTLLGLSPGDVGEMDIPGQKPRRLKVLKIQRQEELLM